MHASLACHVYCACENGHNGASLHVACKCVRSDLVCYIQSINYAHEIQALKQCILRSFWPPSDGVHASSGKHHCNKKKKPAFTVPFKRPARVISNAMSRFLLATVTAGAIRMTVDRSVQRVN